MLAVAGTVTALRRTSGAGRLIVRASRYRRQIGFLAVGGFCFLVQLAVMLTMIRLGSQRSPANAVGFLAGAELKYLLSVHYVWADRPRRESSGRWARFLSFNGTTLLAFGANVAVFAIANRPLGVLAATVFGVLAGTVISYVICDLVIFAGGASLIRALVPVEGLLPDTGVVTEAIPSAPALPQPDARAAMWLVIPAYNEEGRLGATLSEYANTLEPGDHLVVVVNGSVDGTEAIARSRAEDDARLHVLVDANRIGKGGAIRTGLGFVAAQSAPGEIVCYTDADAAINGSEINRLGALAAFGELTIGSRWFDPSTQLRKQPVIRRVASRGFNRCVRSVLGLRLSDTQCPAKAMMVSDVGRVLHRLSSGGFAFDIDLILAAREAGMVTREYPVLWEDQDGSTVSLRSDAPSMLRELFQLRRKYSPAAGQPIAVVDLTERGVIGPTSEFANASIRGGKAAASPVGEDARPPTGPRRVLSVSQVVAGVVALATLAIGLAVAPVVTAVVANSLLIAFFSLANCLKLVLIRRSLNDPCTVVVNVGDPGYPAVDDLPVYTILLPVYREAAVLRQLVDGIGRLDYPSDRLDVKLLLESDDTETREAAAALGLPECFDVLVIPDVGPAGKPRACNYGLMHARGEYLVIYDAEDCPDPDQLRKSVAAFSQMPGDVVCLQAKLNYFNRTYNLLTRWFTAEYSLWFDQLLPGLQSLDVAIPLGGTSNHFVTARLRDLGGWDAHNVTEDADLGIRIFVCGWKTAILDSTTYEEATSGCRNWVRQRSRWVKGYMQTYLFHMRHPVRLAAQMRPKAFGVFHLFFGAGTLCLLLNPIYWVLTGLWYFGHVAAIQSFFPRPVLYVGTIGLFLGNAAFAMAIMSGSYGRRHYDDVKWALLAPLYWVLMSVAAWKALIQLCYRPSYWEKTTHGVCQYVSEDAPQSQTVAGSQLGVAVGATVALAESQPG